ncbi:MAG: PEGA domain-containing protein, partial [Planctomycetaceae bacterium]
MTVGNRTQKTQENRRPRVAATDQPTAESFLVVVETTEPGFRVEVDGILARDNTGEPLVTPCEIALAPGPRSFRLARRSYRDITREVVVIENETISLEAVYDPFGEPTGYFASPFHEVAVGQSVVLPHLLAGGLPQSPWLSQDGLDLWFAGEGSPGRGVFHARRNHTD